MKNNSKKEAKDAIDLFFKKESLDREEVRKIKSLAMKHRIGLKEYRKRFCKKCYSDLRLGKTRISKKHKQVTCGKCNSINRWKLK